MRKVMFKQWIPAKFPDKADSTNYTTTHRPIEGTNCWEADFKNAGLFHQWASAYKELESGAGNFTVALVELVSGEIKEVLPSNIKFMDIPDFTSKDLRTDDATKTV